MIIMYVALGEYIRCVIVLCIMDVVVYMCSALTRAGREEEALHLLEELAENAIHETRSLCLSLSLSPTQSLVFTDRCVCCRFEDALLLASGKVVSEPRQKRSSWLVLQTLAQLHPSST